MLADRVALVTGGGRAIGRAIALRFARKGAMVVVAGRHVDELETTATEIRSAGGKALAVVVDVSHEDQVGRMVEQTHAEFGRIDLLINNAAIIGPTALVPNTSRDDWDETLAVNLTGPFLCAKAVLPEMMARKSGKVINMSSVAGKIGYPLRSPYAVSKWGLIGLTLTLAKEMGPYNIQVNVVCPGPVEGERMRSIIATRAAELGRTVEQVHQEYVEPAALGRMVTDEDVASLVLFLASPAADNITGQAIDVSAGYRL